MEIEITPEHPGEIPEVITHIEGFNGKLRGLLSGIMHEAVEEGRRVAEAEAPRGNLFDHGGGRISDAIQIERSDLSVGGAGGGSAYTTYRLYVSSLIAPHLKFVFEGTGDKSGSKGDPANRIYPARGNVFAIDKGGEGTIFRRWISGQRPQTQWWEDAHYAVEGVVNEGLRGMNLGNI